MVTSGSNRNGKEMQNFSEYKQTIVEKELKPYKLVIFNHSAEMVRDVKDTSLGELIKLLNISANSDEMTTLNP